MNYDREADILYLAHQIWEEMGEAGATPQTCWRQAAQQVMARPGKTEDRPASEPATARHQRYAQSGVAISIDHGTGPARAIAFVRHCAPSDAANRGPAKVRRLAD